MKGKAIINLLTLTSIFKRYLETRTFCIKNMHMDSGFGIISDISKERLANRSLQLLEYNKPSKFISSFPCSRSVQDTELRRQGGGSGSKKSCLVIFKDLNKLETLLFTECQNSILVKSYCNFNFGNLVGSLINLRTKTKF